MWAIHPLGMMQKSISDGITLRHLVGGMVPPCPAGAKMFLKARIRILYVEVDG